MQQPQFQRIVEWFFSLGGWEEKQSGTIGPDERLPWPQTTTMGLQHVLAMFGATIIAPLLMGFDTNLALFFSGIGTLIFFAITLGRVPSYLGSSFAFIAPVTAVMTGGGTMKDALGGILICGIIYALIGAAVEYYGSDWIDSLMPPIVTGAVVAIIGLNLADEARGMVEGNMFLAFVTIGAVLGIALYSGGFVGRLPILLGTVIGYLLAVILGGSEGREIGPFFIQGVNFDGVSDAAWIGFPDFVGPSFSLSAIAIIAPVALVLVAENTGHIKAVSEMSRTNLMPYLGRGFIGDGVATTVAGMGGGTGVTTYAENIGVMAVTRVYSTAMFVVAGLVAILLSLCPKFGALVGSIPSGVLGGVATVLFGLIALTGFRIWIENRVDFTHAPNLFIVAVAVIAGTANYTIHLGDFSMEGIGLSTFGIIILYQLLGKGGSTPSPRPAPATAPAQARVEAASSRSTQRPKPARPSRAGERPHRGGEQRRGVLDDLPDVFSGETDEPRR